MTNGGEKATEGLSITNRITTPSGKEEYARFGVDVSANPVLDPGESSCYPYEFKLVGIPTPGITYKKTADVTITNHSGYLGQVFGPSPSSTSQIGTSPTLINDMVHVSDTNLPGAVREASSSASFSYPKIFSCDQDRGTQENTAIIQETSQSDSATVSVNCFALNVDKNVRTAFDRTYRWNVDKRADQTNLTLALNQLFNVNYTLNANAAFSDSNHLVAGSIQVSNPAPIDAVVMSVRDLVSNPGAVATPDALSATATPVVGTVVCSSGFPTVLRAGQSLSCDYQAGLSDASPRLNVAEATIRNSAVADARAIGAISGGSTTFSSEPVAVDFGTASINEIDKSADLVDSLQGFIANLTYGSTALPYLTSYPRPVGPYNTCGDFNVANTASINPIDSHSISFSDWNIGVNVPCNLGCTLTIGYWKNHAGFGPQQDMLSRHLSVYLGVAPAAGTVNKSLLVNTAKIAVDVLSQQVYGKASNLVTKLYAQLLAAKLNGAAGANLSTVSSAISAADAFLATKNWNDTLTKAQQAQVLVWQTALDQFNNGLLGPSHCSQ